MQEVYRLEHVQFQYNADVVLEDATFCVHPADFVGIVGENGGGKTTLLRLLTGECKPLAGRLFFYGQEGVRGPAMRRIGYVPQMNPTTGMAFPISCREVVSLGLTRSIVPRFFLNRSEKQKVDDSLAHLGVEALADRNFHALSGGQKQRVLIAKALVDAPDVLLFDEPTVGIDEESKAQFVKTLDHMNQVHGITILVVTHERDIGEGHWNRLFCVQEHRVREVKVC